MDIRRLRLFVSVARFGSVHRAADQLGMAQPVLSRNVRELEEQLGATLFTRSAKGVRLTPVGEVLLAEAERLLPQIEEADVRVRRAVLGRFGFVRVAFTTVVAELRTAFAAFSEARDAMPEVDFQLRIIASDHQLGALVSGDIDVGILYRRGETPADLHYRDLRVDRYMLLTPSRHPLTRKASVRLADLRDQELVFVSKTAQPLTYDDYMEACSLGGFSPRIAYEPQSEVGMLNLVAEGLAIAFSNSSLRERRPTEGVTYLDIADYDRPLPLSVMWRRDRETPATLRLVELLESHLMENLANVPPDGAADAPADRRGL